MNANHFFLILYARRWTLFLVLAVTITTTVVVSLLLPKSYTATTSVVVNFKNNDPVGRSSYDLPIQLSSTYMTTQEEIITSPRVAATVVANLKLDRESSVMEQFQEETHGKGSLRNWLAEQLLKKLTVTPSRDSRIITLEFDSSDPQFSALVASAFAQAYIDTTLELNVAPARHSAAWFDEQLKGLRDAAEASQRKLAQYQHRHNIVTTDERLDTENAKLNQQAHDLITAQAEVQSIESRIEQANKLILSSDRESETIPEVMNNGFIQGLKTDLVRQQAKLDELSRTVGHNHPNYKAAVAEINSLRIKLTTEIKNVAQSLENSLKLAKTRAASLQKSVDTQRGKLLEWKSQREELDVLMNEAKNAQLAYESAMQRASQITLESRVNQTDVSVLSPAIPPIEHSRPNLLLNTLLSILLGTILAVAAALIRESMDRRIRSDSDVTEALALPLLGVIQRDKDNTPYAPVPLLSSGN